MALMAAPRKLVLKCLGLAVLAAAGISCVAAADSYKCKNSAGRITYSNETCEKQGLQPAGSVRDRVMVVPAYKPADVPSQSAAKGGEKDDARSARTIKPASPLTDKLAK